MRSLRKWYKSKVVAARWVARCFGLALLTGQLSFAADNVTVSNGQNSDNPDYVTATDDVSGVHYQRMKLIDPTADSTQAIGVSGNPLWCSITGTVPLPTGASTSALQSTGNTSLSSIDGTLSSILTELGQKTEPANTQTINLAQYGGVGTSLGSKAATASVPVVIANNQDFTATTTFAPGGRGIIVGLPDFVNGGQYAWSGNLGSAFVEFTNTSLDVKPLIISSTAGSITGNGQSVTLTNNARVVSVLVWGTYSNINLTFEYSADGSTWVAVPMMRLDTGTMESTSGALTNTTRAWRVGLFIGGQMRVRSTSFTSGTMSVSISPYQPFGDVTPGVWANQAGTWNVNNISGTVSLPTGAATSANQTTEITALQLLDDVVATTGSAIPTKGNAISGTDGTNARILKTDTNGEIQADILSSALPTGAATETTLTSVDGKLPALVSGRVPVDGSGVTQPVSGTLTCNAGTNLNTSALALESGGNLATAATALGVLDDWDESDRAKVNPISGQAGIDGGSGASSAKTTRVVIATDQGGFAVNATYYASLTNTGTTSLSTARKFYGLKCGNGSTTTQGFAKAYDKATAATSSDTPIGGGKVPLGPLAGWSDKIDYFSYLSITNGLSLRCTTGVADSNTTSPTANDCFCTVYWNT